jgi:predicted nuclease of predicted toxin-antitoxin system
MRFLVDESTGAAVVQFLRSLGHDVEAVAETMPSADDAVILQKAVTEQFLVVTNDKDFGDLVYRSGQAHVGIVLLRLKDESAANRVAVVKAILEKHAADLPGNFVVASETNVRVRKPPTSASPPGLPPASS